LKINIKVLAVCIAIPLIAGALSGIVTSGTMDSFESLEQPPLSPPSWLFPVNLGATTMWEHWDSIDENGEMWSPKMNSFNHYAYGAVADWIYEVAAGIKQTDDSAGFEKIVIKPHPDRRLEFLEATYETKYGLVYSKWQYTDFEIVYEITVPTNTVIIINGKEEKVSAGNYIYREILQ